MFKLDSMNYIDQSGIYVLEEIISGLNNSNKSIYFSGLQSQPKLMFEKMGLFDSKIKDENVFEDHKKCIDQNYVRISCGYDFIDASPIKGVKLNYLGEEALNFKLDINIEQ